MLWGVKDFKKFDYCLYSSYRIQFLSDLYLWWILWFSVRYATAAAYREIFGLNALRKKNRPARFTKFAGYLYWEVSFFGTEITLILKSKMAAMGISLKIIYLFLPSGTRMQKVKPLHR